MKPTVLVAAMPDERGREALALGVILARPLGAQIVLAGVSRARGGEASSQLLDEMTDVARSAPLDVAISVEVVSWTSGSLLPSLENLAVEHDAQVLVVNPEERGLIGRALHRDAVAEAVFGAACAVAVPAQGQARRMPRTVGVAWNGSQESYEALEWATQFAERTEAALQLIRVVNPRHAEGSPPDPAIAERLQELADATMPRASTAARLEWGDVGPVLIEITHDLDLLVLGSSPRGPLRRTLVGSVSTDLVHHAHCPVVVLPRGVHAPVGAVSM